MNGRWAGGQVLTKASSSGHRRRCSWLPATAATLSMSATSHTIWVPG